MAIDEVSFLRTQCSDLGECSATDHLKGTSLRWLPNSYFFNISLSSTTTNKKNAHKLTLSSLPLKAVLLIVSLFQDWVVSDVKKDIEFFKDTSVNMLSADSVFVPVYRCLFLASAGKE